MMLGHKRFGWLLVTLNVLMIESFVEAQDVNSYRKTIYDSLYNNRSQFIDAMDAELRKATDPDIAEAIAKSKERMLSSLRDLRIPEQVPPALLSARKNYKLSSYDKICDHIAQLKKLTASLTQSGNYEEAKKAKSLYLNFESDYKLYGLLDLVGPVGTTWKGGTGSVKGTTYNFLAQRQEDTFSKFPFDFKIVDCVDNTITVEINADNEMYRAKLVLTSDHRAEGKADNGSGSIELYTAGDSLMCKFNKNSKPAMFTVRAYEYPKSNLPKLAR